jgi:hypothetical protein
VHNSLWRHSAVEVSVVASVPFYAISDNSFGEADFCVQPHPAGHVTGAKDRGGKEHLTSPYVLLPRNTSYAGGEAVSVRHAALQYYRDRE